MTERSKAIGIQATPRLMQPDINGQGGNGSDASTSKTGLFVSGANEKRTKMGLVIPGPRPTIDAMMYPQLTKAEFVRVNPYVVAVDLRPILRDINPNWQGELLEVAREQPDAVIKPGFDETSMATPGTEPTYYQPTKQKVIKERLPLFHSLFQNEIRFLAERLMKDRSMRLGADESALNMNRTKEGPYELHLDRNILTALLGVTDVQEGQGGELVIHERRNKFGLPEGKQFRIRPQAGILYFFNGHKHPHEVTPYVGPAPRVVMPGDYYSERNPEIIDTKFNEEIGLGAQLLARERLSDGGQLVVVDFSRNGKNGSESQMPKRESVTLVSGLKAA